MGDGGGRLLLAEALHALSRRHGCWWYVKEGERAGLLLGGLASLVVVMDFRGSLFRLDGFFCVPGKTVLGQRG